MNSQHFRDNMNVNIFNPEWNGAEKSSFCDLLKQKNINVTAESFKAYVHINKPMHYSACGKSSLYAILKANNIGKKDEVILPCYCCESVAYPVRKAGARPVLADIDPSDLNISSDSIAELITPNTKAVIVPSLYGNPANILEIQKIVGEELLIINDLAQGYGASLNNSPMEIFGDTGFVSCGPGKQLAGGGGSVYWLNEGRDKFPLKNQNQFLNRVFHELFFQTRVNIDKNIGSLFYRILSLFYLALNQNAVRVNRSATALDLSVMLMLMENYGKKLGEKKVFLSEVDNISKNRSFRVLKAQRGKASPVKIVLIFNSEESCGSAKTVLKQHEIYYSTGYKKINGVEKVPLRGLCQVYGKILEVPLEVAKKAYLLDALNKIN